MQALHSANARWLVADQLGTPRMVFDKTGALSNVKRHDYLPFGEELYAGIGGRISQQGYSSDSVRQKFTAYEHDAETNLEFAEARYYSSSGGRFTSPDPFSGSMELTDPQTLNRYSYVSNDPVNSTDPSGMIMGSRKDGASGDISVLDGSIGNFMGGQQSQQGEPEVSADAIGAAISGIVDANATAQTGGSVVDAVVAPQNTNPNCIVKSVEGGTLAVKPSNNIEADPRTGGNIHDGIHVVAPLGKKVPVTALPAMAGVVDHAGRQSSKPDDAGYQYSVVYVLLNVRLNGERLVLGLVDMYYDSGLNRKGQQVIPGHRIGFVDNFNGNEGGLHVNLMLYSTYRNYIVKGNWSYRARRSVPTNLLIDAARDPRSPFRCQ